MAQITSWQELNDTFTAITKVFQSNEDPLHCYHKLYFKQDRSPQLYNTLRQISNVSTHSNKGVTFTVTEKINCHQQKVRAER